MGCHNLTCLPVVSLSIVSATADSLDYNLTAHFTDSTGAISVNQMLTGKIFFYKWAHKESITNSAAMTF